MKPFIDPFTGETVAMGESGFEPVKEDKPSGVNLGPLSDPQFYKDIGSNLANAVPPLVKGGLSGAMELPGAALTVIGGGAATVGDRLRALHSPDREATVSDVLSGKAPIDTTAEDAVFKARNDTFGRAKKALSPGHDASIPEQVLYGIGDLAGQAPSVAATGNALGLSRVAKFAGDATKLTKEALASRGVTGIPESTVERAVAEGINTGKIPVPPLSGAGRAAAGAGAIAPIAVPSGVDTATSLIDQGVPLDKAEKAGLASAGVTSVIGAVPVSIPGKLPLRMISGAAVGVLADVASRWAQRLALEGDKHAPELIDPKSMTVSALLFSAMGGAFGPKAKSIAEKAYAEGSDGAVNAEQPAGDGGVSGGALPPPQRRITSQQEPVVSNPPTDTNAPGLRRQIQDAREKQALLTTQPDNTAYVDSAGNVVGSDKAQERFSSNPALYVNKDGDAMDLAQRKRQITEHNAAAHEAATSPVNTLSEPTQAQKESGNYKKGHIKWNGMDVTIENPVGSTRSGIGPDGKPWEVGMQAHYGYVRGTNGADGEQVDVYMTDQATDDSPVYVVDQYDADTGKFDEHKAIIGAQSDHDAAALYDAHFNDGRGPERRGAITRMSAGQFKDWVKSRAASKPIGQAALPAPKILTNRDGVAMREGDSRYETLGLSQDIEKARRSHPAAIPDTGDVAERDYGPLTRPESRQKPRRPRKKQAPRPEYPASEAPVGIEVRVKKGRLAKRGLTGTLVRSKTARSKLAIKMSDGTRVPLSKDDTLVDMRPRSELQAEEDDITHPEQNPAEEKGTAPTEPAQPDEQMTEPPQGGKAEPSSDYDAAIKDLNERLGRISANPLADPAIYRDLITIGAKHVRDGAHSFAQFAGRMRASLGDAFRQFAKKMREIYDNVLRHLSGEPMVGINVEIAPNPDNKALTATFNGLQEAGKKDATYKVAQKIIPKAAERLGYKLDSIEYTIGGFKGETNPSLIVHLSKDTPYSDVVEFGRDLGVILSQQAVITYDDSVTSGPDVIGFVRVAPSRSLSYNQNKILYDFIGRKVPHAEGFMGRDGAQYYGNYPQEDGSGPTDDEFHDQIDAALEAHQADYSVETTLKRLKSNYIDTAKGNSHEGNASETEARGEVLRRRQGGIDSLKAEADAALGEAIGQRSERGAKTSPSVVTSEQPSREVSRPQHARSAKVDSPSNEISANEAENTLIKHFGNGMAEAIDSGSVRVLAKESDLSKYGLDHPNGGVGGVYAEGPDTIYLIAENMSSNPESRWYPVNVLLHESEHANLEDMLGPDLYKDLTGRVNTALTVGKKDLEAGRGHQSDFVAAVMDAYRHVPADTAPEDVASEVMANMAQDPKARKLSLIKRLIAAIRAWLYRHGIKLGKKTYRPENLSDAAIVSMIKTATAERYTPHGERKSLEKRRGNLAKEIRAAKASQTPPIFYSPTLKALKEVKQNKATPEQWLAMLRKNGAKQEEMEWMDVPGFMEGKKSVTKDELQQFIESNGVDVQEVVKSSGDTKSIAVRAGYSVEFDPDENAYIAYDQNGDVIFDSGGDVMTFQNEGEAWQHFADQTEDFLDYGDHVDGDGTKFDQYTFPGGEDYKELLLTLPGEPRTWQQARDDLVQKAAWIKNKTTYDELSSEQKDKFARFYGDNESFMRHKETMPANAYRSPHYDEPNIVVHIRFDTHIDADGKRVMVLQEVQADKGQRWRKLRALVQSGKASDAEVEEFNSLDSMPFNKTTSWAMLGFKRAIRWAVDNGYDKIAWTTGEQQAERYDLSKQVDNIRIVRRAGDKFDLYVKKDGATVLSKDKIDGKELADTIGKDLADKAANELHEPMQGKEYTGLDLKVGGEGMKGFYDNILPKAVNKYVKKFGAKVGTSDISLDNDASLNSEREFNLATAQGILRRGGEIYVKSTEDPNENLISSNDELTDYMNEVGVPKTFIQGDIGGTVSVHAIDITPAMRIAAVKGQPMFSRAYKTLTAFWRMYTERDDAFRTPKANETTGDIHDIAKKYIGGVKIKHEVKEYKSKDGKYNLIEILAETEDGGMEPFVTLNALNTKHPHITINDSNTFARNVQGFKFYQAALTWMHKNHRRAYPDATLLPVNNLRRTEALITSALKFGTTDHLDVHPSQFVGLLTDEEYAHTGGETFVSVGEYDKNPLINKYTQGVTVSVDEKTGDFIMADENGEQIPDVMGKKETYGSIKATEKAIRLVGRMRAEEAVATRLGKIKQAMFLPEEDAVNEMERRAIFEYNVDNLIAASVALVEKRVPDIKAWRFENGKVVYTGNPSEAVPVISSRPTLSQVISSEVRGKTGVGDTTFERTLISRSIIGAKDLGVVASELLERDQHTRELFPGFAPKRSIPGRVADSETLVSPSDLRKQLQYARRKYSRRGDVAEAAPRTKIRKGSTIDRALQAAGGKLLADRITGPLYTKTLDILDSLSHRVLGQERAEYLKAAFTDRYGLDETYKSGRFEYSRRLDKGARDTKTLVEALGDLDSEQSRIAYLWLTGRNADHLLNSLPSESRNTLKAIKQAIDDMGKRAVDLGLLSEASRRRNESAYLHRTFRKYELEQTNGQRRSRGKAVKILGEQFRGRGLKDYIEDDKLIQHVDEVKTGDKLIRLERRDKNGRLQQRVYVSAGKPIPAKFQGWGNDGVWEARFFDKKNKVGMWRDFTKDELRRMGEIEEARYAVAVTMLKMSRDLETAEFQRWVADRYGKDEAPDDAEVLDGEETLWRVYKKDSWVKVPSSKVQGTSVPMYGALAGKFVPGPVWNDIRQVRDIEIGDPLRGYNDLIRGWKISKTALSPGVHMNNVMANIVMADWHNVQAPEILRALKAAIAAKKGDAKAQAVIDAFEDSGASGGLFTHVELKASILEPLIEKLEEDIAQADVHGATFRAASILALTTQGRLGEALDGLKQTKLGRLTGKAAGKMRDLYELEDVWFRLAAFMKAKHDGMSDTEAGKFARRSFVDYDINAPYINIMRKTGWPFMAFGYRVAPMLLETVAHRPWKMYKLMAFLGLANALAYAMLGAGGNEDKERKYLPKEKKGKIFGIIPKLMRMPWNDAQGNPVFLDIRRWVPVGDIFDTQQYHSAVEFIPSPLMPTGPLVMGAELIINKGSFSGREVVPESDKALESPSAEQALLPWMETIDYIWKGLAPNFPIPNPVGYATEYAIDEAPVGLFQTYSWAGIEQAARHDTSSKLGRRRTLPQAVLNAIGIKAESYSIEQMRNNIFYEYKRNDNEIRKEIRRLQRQRAETDSDLQKKRIDRKIQARYAREKKLYDEVQARIK